MTRDQAAVPRPTARSTDRTSTLRTHLSAVQVGVADHPVGAVKSGRTRYEWGVTPLRVASLALAGLLGSSGCWISVPVLESSASPGLVPAVIAPEVDGAVVVAEAAEEPLDEIDGDPSLLDDASPQLEVEAELIEPRSAPHCGKAKWVVVMRYAVRQVIAGSYGERELYVAQMCPEMGLGLCRGEGGTRVRGFKAGDVHRLKLVKGTGSGSIVDKFARGPSAEFPRYRSRCGSLVEPT